MRSPNYKKYHSNCYATNLSPEGRVDLYQKLVTFYESVQEAYPTRPKRALGHARNNLVKALKEIE